MSEEFNEKLPGSDPVKRWNCSVPGTECRNEKMDGQYLEIMRHITGLNEKMDSQHEAVIAGLNMISDRHLSRHVDSMTIIQTIANALNIQTTVIGNLQERVQRVATAVAGGENGRNADKGEE